MKQLGLSLGLLLMVGLVAEQAWAQFSTTNVPITNLPQPSPSPSPKVIPNRHLQLQPASVSPRWNELNQSERLASLKAIYPGFWKETVLGYFNLGSPKTIYGPFSTVEASASIVSPTQFPQTNPPRIRPGAKLIVELKGGFDNVHYMVECATSDPNGSIGNWFVLNKRFLGSKLVEQQGANKLIRSGMAEIRSHTMRDINRTIDRMRFEFQFGGLFPQSEGTYPTLVQCRAIEIRADPFALSAK